ncbi:ABC transporter ATP-binding protein [Paenibacillus sp. FSL H3-0333]|uniref:ABC transporter ATP-binding protein n=1 Tax=Paenibacillus sp. FSL H3-0333 TaxID=2921373 RepID=UPI0030FCE53F
MTLSLANIKKCYREKLIFENIYLEVEPGQIVALQGKSGTGKSTLLNLVAGLEKPSEGEVLLGNIKFKDMSLNDLSSIRGKYIGYISQHNPMIPKLTALENITVPLWFNKKNKSQIEVYDHIKKLSHFLQVDQILNSKIEKLSGGELQRIGIIRALLMKPMLIVADEPTASLDEETAGLVINCFNTLKSEGAIILLATHNTTIASECDFTYFLTQDGLVS